MNDSIYDPELTDPRVSYTARYENDGRVDDRVAAVSARAARAMRDGDRYMDGSARDGLRRVTPGSLRSGPDRGHDLREPRAGEHSPRRYVTMSRRQAQLEAG
jgi:hypothetical protein